MDWKSISNAEKHKDYYPALRDFVNKEYAERTCYPRRENLFYALKCTPFEDVKCVILGQDPYHEPGQAMGLAFSVPSDQPIPPSLINIYKEINREYGYDIPKTGDLTPWAKQGVLLLNTVLSVRAHEAASHQGHGWEQYTDSLLEALNKRDTPIVFMLWGRFAQSKEHLITNPIHLVLKTSHPSPLSVYRGFEGCGHFKACNVFLRKRGIAPIDWRITD